MGRWRASVARWGDVITHAWFSRRARAGAGWVEGSPRDARVEIGARPLRSEMAQIFPARRRVREATRNADAIGGGGVDSTGHAPR